MCEPGISLLLSFLSICWFHRQQKQTGHSSPLNKGTFLCFTRMSLLPALRAAAGNELICYQTETSAALAVHSCALVPPAGRQRK